MYHVCKSDEERDQECAFKRMKVKESVCLKIKYFKRVRVQTENTSGECTEAKIKKTNINKKGTKIKV